MAPHNLRRLCSFPTHCRIKLQPQIALHRTPRLIQTRPFSMTARLRKQPDPTQEAGASNDDRSRTRTQPSPGSMPLSTIKDYASLILNVGFHWPIYAETLSNIFYKLPTRLQSMFGAKDSYDPKRDVPDLTGKVAIVTGGNAGLGKNSVLELARHGAKVYMASRTESKARQSISEILAQLPTAQIEYLHLDLASLDSVKLAATTFLSQEPVLHILLNNAGVMAMAPQQTADGYDIQWATNHLGHAHLTQLLLPALLAAAATSPPNTVRIVNVSSQGHRAARSFGINFADTALASSSRFTRYGQSKLANILYAKALAKRYGPRGIVAVSCHPGTIFTELYTPFTSSLGFLGSVVAFPLRMVMTTTEIGSFNQIACCTSPEVTVQDGGAYYIPVLKKSVPSGFGQDEALADKLWDYTEEELRGRGESSG